MFLIQREDRFNKWNSSDWRRLAQRRAATGSFHQLLSRVLITTKRKRDTILQNSVLKAKKQAVHHKMSVHLLGHICSARTIGCLTPDRCEALPGQWKTFQKADIHFGPHYFFFVSSFTFLKMLCIRIRETAARCSWLCAKTWTSQFTWVWKLREVKLLQWQTLSVWIRLFWHETVPKW